MLLWFLTWLLTLAPCGSAEHRSLWRHLPARVFAPGEAGCRSVHRLARDGLSVAPATSEKRRGPGNRASASCDCPAHTSGRLSLVTFFGDAKKVTRRRQQATACSQGKQSVRNPGFQRNAGPDPSL